MPADYTHSPTAEELMAYLDGEAPAESRAWIEAHLAGCKECEMAAASFRRVSHAAAEWTVEPAPASMRTPDSPVSRPAAARVLKGPGWRPSRFVLAGLTTAAAALLVVSYHVSTRRAAPATSAAMLPLGGVQPADRRAVAAGRQMSEIAKDEVKVSSHAAVDAVSAPASRAIMQAPRPASVIRTASLEIVAKEFGGVRAAVEAIVSQAGGFIDQMTITGDTSTARALRGTLRVPGDRLPEALARLRQLGQVVEDTQGSQDVSDQLVDLDARLASARATEQRLTDLLRNRTGKLSDVLDVERELARVRLDIERLDAEKANIGRRVSYATIDLSIAEERKEGLVGPLSLATRIRVAAADGLESAIEGMTATLLFVLRAGPTLVLLSLAVGIAWWFGRRLLRLPSAG